MALTLYVDGDRWRAHLRAALDAEPGLVPVAKGNGYGFGVPRLARKAQRLGVDTLAVGQYDEVAAVESRFDGSILVLTPWRPFVDAPIEGPEARRLIHTVGRPEDLTELVRRARIPRGGPRVVLELLTSMRRHGFSAAGLRTAVASVPGSVTVEGIALHLPLSETGDHAAEVDRLMTDVVAADLDVRTIWVSHLTRAGLAQLGASWPDFTFRPRVGTALWLGDRGALQVRATVLDAHPVARGDAYGYRGRTAPRKGTVLVVSGGTSHGIGLEAPTGDSSLRSRAGTLARGGLDAAGLVRSPYAVDGKLRFFAEPPHMQVSMLFLPSGVPVPAVGDEVDVRVRFTATHVDQVEIS
ncbi:MAG: alanine racemase domain protein [Nocardioidaceae bacterium]|nr:alanine racemase domain protein [Nocardioidaceae bacterium]